MIVLQPCDLFEKLKCHTGKRLLKKMNETELKAVPAPKRKLNLARSRA